MNKKVLTKTYLREAVKYQVRLFLDEDDKWVVVKKLIEITEPFIIRENVTGMDNGYYVLELIPKNENYALRIFFDENKNIVEYYYDVIKSSGIDEETKVPYFWDLYLDVTYNEYFDDIHILDEDELEEAYRTGVINKEDYKMAIEVKDKLVEEIKSKTNKYLKYDYSKYLKDF